MITLEFWFSEYLSQELEMDQFSLNTMGFWGDEWIPKLYWCYSRGSEWEI